MVILCCIRRVVRTEFWKGRGLQLFHSFSCPENTSITANSSPWTIVIEVHLIFRPMFFLYKQTNLDIEISSFLYPNKLQLCTTKGIFHYLTHYPLETVLLLYYFFPQPYNKAVRAVTMKSELQLCKRQLVKWLIFSLWSPLKSLMIDPYIFGTSTGFL